MITICIHLHQKFFLSFTLYEVGSKFFGVRINVETQLCEDCDPDVIGPDNEVVVVTVCFDAGLDEAVACSDYVGGFCGAEG